MEKWHPGHITEAKRKLLDNLKACDTVIEVVDARAPFASRNKELANFIKNKNRVLVVNKIDLIDENIALNIEKSFKDKYRHSIAVSCKDGRNIKRVFQVLDFIFKKKREKMLRRKMNAFPIRVIILGMPNVGKSKLINMLTGRKIAGVANRPGFTRGKQWVKILPNVELLDTPGILWTNHSDNELKKLSLIGSLKDSFHNLQGALTHLIEIIGEKKLYAHYGIEKDISIAVDLANKMKITEEEAVKKIVRDFRSSNIGKISLESA